MTQQFLFAIRGQLWYDFIGNLTAMPDVFIGNRGDYMTDARAWKPKYSLTNSIVNKLTEIEAARVFVENTALTPLALAELTHQARVRSTHYSTRIEGNRLTLQEAEEIISGHRRVLHGRERDVAEVLHYWDALVAVEEWAGKSRPLTEELVQRIAGMVMLGKRARPAPYRNGQNVIRDSTSGGIVYLPPEASDVPILMGELVNWIRRAEVEGVPAVIIAGLAHYQFVTIHPYYDGNGRTARLLATFLLHRGGYGLRGLLSLEEYHSREVADYYGALDVGAHHNYYMGRAEADLTGWLEYFVRTLSAVFDAANREAAKCAGSRMAAEPEELRQLDHRARLVLMLFSRRAYIASADVASTLGISERMARVLLARWVNDGWLVMADPSRKARKYTLAESLRRYMSEIGQWP